MRRVHDLVEIYAPQRILLAKEWVTLFEGTPEFIVAELDGEIVGCGALHVLWEDLAEVRTLAVDPSVRGQGIGHELLERLVSTALELGLTRLFCLTFETTFFERHGFREIHGAAVEPEVYAQLLRSFDDGVAEFLELERVKPNTLGNSRMLRDL